MTPRINKLWIGPVLAFIFSFIFIDEGYGIRIFLGLVLGTIMFILQFLIQFAIVRAIKENQPYLKREKGFMPSLLILAAELVKIDGKVSQSEIEHIKTILNSDFKPKQAEEFHALFLTYLESDQDIRPICKFINYDYDDYLKVHLMYYLVSIVTADGVLSRIELAMLKEIAKRCEIRASTFKRSFKLFEYKTEQTYEEQSRRATNKAKPRTRSQKLAKAYDLFDLTPHASVEQIKKVYRELAKLNHPDKVAYLGIIHQKKAKEKFQLIVDAYETIKASKGFN